MYIVYIYHTVMIRSIKHKGLTEFYLTGRLKGIQAHHAARLRILLTADRKSTRLNSSHVSESRMPSSA